MVYNTWYDATLGLLSTGLQKILLTYNLQIREFLFKLFAFEKHSNFEIGLEILQKDTFISRQFLSNHFNDKVVVYYEPFLFLFKIHI